MKIHLHTADLKLRHTFTISRGSSDVVRTVIAALEAEGITGYGEASPSEYYNHTPESVLASLERVRPLLAESDPLPYGALIDRLEEALEGDRAALAALDIALHDWAGKRFGIPIYRLLGLDPGRMPLSSFTIGIDTIPHMVEKTREASGFPILKVKLGTSHDLELIRALREVSGAVFRVDANCAWSASETIEKSRALKELGVEFIEQPLPPENLEEMAEVRKASALPLYADESAVVPGDVPGLAGRFDGIVVKLVKCGGLANAIRMIHVARAIGLKVMIGCMIESSISITAGTQIGPLVDHLDLDGAILTTNDPFTGSQNDRGRITLPPGPGIGVAPGKDWNQ